MKTLRTALLMVGTALLTLGYLTSQFAAFQGWAKEYAQKVDQAPIQKLALVIFLGAIILSFLPDREDAPS